MTPAVSYWFNSLRCFKVSSISRGCYRFHFLASILFQVPQVWQHTSFHPSFLRFEEISKTFNTPYWHSFSFLCVRVVEQLEMQQICKIVRTSFARCLVSRKEESTDRGFVFLFHDKTCCFCKGKVDNVLKHFSIIQDQNNTGLRKTCPLSRTILRAVTSRLSDCH